MSVKNNAAIVQKTTAPKGEKLARLRAVFPCDVFSWYSYCINCVFGRLRPEKASEVATKEVTQ